MRKYKKNCFLLFLNKKLCFYFEKILEFLLKKWIKMCLKNGNKNF